MATTSTKQRTPGRVIGRVCLDDQLIDGNNDSATVDLKSSFAVEAYPPEITSLADLDLYLPKICNHIFQQIGSQQLEATYQRCLKIDLEEAGIPVVELEPEIQLTYKGKVVGTRRADILLVMNGENAILELKAVDEMNMDHMQQLEYYLHHSGVDKGYLINFPHDCRFPTVDDKSSFKVSFLHGIKNKVQHLLQGGGSTLRLRNSPRKREVEVLEVTRKSMTKSEQEVVLIKKQNKSPPRFGLKANGDECQVCIRKGKFCHMHINQKPKE